MLAPPGRVGLGSATHVSLVALEARQTLAQPGRAGKMEGLESPTLLPQAVAQAAWPQRPRASSAPGRARVIHISERSRAARRREIVHGILEQEEAACYCCRVSTRIRNSAYPSNPGRISRPRAEVFTFILP